MRPSGESGLLRWGARSAAALLATAAVLTGAPASASTARLPACFYHYFSAGWAVSSAKLTFVRSGTWTSNGSSVTGTETDTMSPVTRPLANKDALYLSQLCSPWILSLTAFARPGSQRAQWPTGEPGSGGCNLRRSFPANPEEEGFVLDVGGAPRAVQDRFKLGAKQVRIFVAVMVPPGLSCPGPLANTTFDFPTMRFVSSDPVTVSTKTLTKNRAFTLNFRGSAGFTETWYGGYTGYPIGTEQFRVSWSGAIGFKPTGCGEWSEASGQISSACYPG